MDTLLTILIWLSGSLVALIAYANELPDKPGVNGLIRSLRFKIAVTVFAFILALVSTIWKDSIAEQAKQDTISQQIKRDSLIDAKNETDKLNIIKTFTDGFARYELKINNLLPLISDVKIHSLAGGINISYQLNREVEKLTLTLGPTTFDDTFDGSFGAGVLELPKKIGRNSYTINFAKLGLGEQITLLIKSENPYQTLPIIEHSHNTNSTTEVFITADNMDITTDDGRLLTTEDGKKIATESKKN